MGCIYWVTDVTSEFSRAQRTLGRPQPSPVWCEPAHLERRWRGPPVKGVECFPTQGRFFGVAAEARQSSTRRHLRRPGRHNAGITNLQVRSSGNQIIAPHRSWADRVVSFRTSQASICCRLCPTRRVAPPAPWLPLLVRSSLVHLLPAAVVLLLRHRGTPISGGQNLSTLGSCTPLERSSA